MKCTRSVMSASTGKVVAGVMFALVVSTPSLVEAIPPPPPDTRLVLQADQIHQLAGEREQRKGAGSACSVYRESMLSHS